MKYKQGKPEQTDYSNACSIENSKIAWVLVLDPETSFVNFSQAEYDNAIALGQIRGLIPVAGRLTAEPVTVEVGVRRRVLYFNYTCEFSLNQLDPNIGLVNYLNEAETKYSAIFITKDFKGYYAKNPNEFVLVDFSFAPAFEREELETKDTSTLATFATTKIQVADVGAFLDPSYVAPPAPPDGMIDETARYYVVQEDENAIDPIKFSQFLTAQSADIDENFYFVGYKTNFQAGQRNAQVSQSAFKSFVEGFLSYSNKFKSSDQHSVLGVSGGAAAQPSDIGPAEDGQVLLRRGATLGFDKINFTNFATAAPDHVLITNSQGLVTSQAKADTFNAGVKRSIEVDAGSLQLVGDVDSPGNSKIYGTNGAGQRGWYDLPTPIVSLQAAYDGGNGTIITDGAKEVEIQGGGVATDAIFRVRGISGGILYADSQNLGFRTSSFGLSSNGVIGIGNATQAPTGNPTGGSVLYSNGGRLKTYYSGGEKDLVVSDGALTSYKIAITNANGDLIDNANLTFQEAPVNRLRLYTLSIDNFGFLRDGSGSNVLATFGNANNAVRMGQSVSGGNLNAVGVGRTVNLGTSQSIGVGNNISALNTNTIRIGGFANVSLGNGIVMGYLSGGSTVSGGRSIVLNTGQTANRNYVVVDSNVIGGIEANLTYTGVTAFGNDGTRPSFLVTRDGNVFNVGENYDLQTDAQITALEQAGTGAYHLFNATAPTGSNANGFSMYSADITPGNAAPHFMIKNNVIIKLYQQAAIADASGGGVVDAEARAALNELLAVNRNNGFIAT